MALLAILMGMVYGTVAHAVRVRTRLETAVRKFETVQGLLERMRSDLEGTYAELQASSRKKGGDRAQPHWILYLNDQEGNGAPADELVFSSLANKEYFIEGEDHNIFSHEEIGYNLQAPPEDDNSDGYDMMRRSDVTMDRDPLEGGNVYRLASGLRGFNVRLYSEKEKGWEDSWDSRDKPGEFPVAAEITLWYGGVEDDQDSWIPVALLVPFYNRNFGSTGGYNDLNPKNSTKNNKASSGGIR